MVPYKPYAALVYPLVQNADSNNIAKNLEKLIPQTVLCYYEPLTPGETFQRYGVELKQPATLQCEVFDGEKFSPSAEVLVGGRVWTVIGNPEIHDSGNDADHADILLDFKQYPNTI